MCFFFKKKKEKPVINSKFKEGDPVSFWYKGNLRLGYVYSISLAEDQTVIYDVQIGGECPVVVGNLREANLIARPRKNG